MVESEVLRVQEHNRLICQRREAGVDVRDDVGNTALNFVLLRRLESDLDENDFATEVRVLVQEGFEGEELVAYALRY